MLSINLNYKDKEQLIEYSKKHDLDNKDNLLLQIFTGICEEDYITTLIKDITIILPNAKIIGSTTDGEIVDGGVKQNSTVISFSMFDNTKIDILEVALMQDSYQTGVELAKLIQNIEDKKVLISFVSGLRVNGEDYLRAFEDEDPELTIAGGLAGDNAKFTGTIIFTHNGISKYGAIGAVLSSKTLHVNTHYNFSWERIGKTLTVTSSEKNRVYTIDHINAENIYRQYLGDEVGDMLPATGIEFPLIIQKDNLSIARAVLNKHEDGSLSFAGNIPEGAKVQFGYGNIESILSEAPKKTNEMLQYPIESIFVYSCMARKRLLGDGIVAELELLSQVAPMSGFFTYGEFFHHKSCSNELLNQTMTILTLSENEHAIHTNKLNVGELNNNSSHTVSALSHLISVTSAELQNLNEGLELKVMQKTSQLKKLNTDLEEKVKIETAKVQEQYKVLADTQKAMIENEKFASLGTLVAGVAHEINTPVGLSLTGITHILDQLKKLDTAFKSGEMTESDFTDFVDETKVLSESINTNLKKAAHLVKSFKQVAVDQSSEEDRHFNLFEYVDEIFVSLHNKIKLTNIKTQIDIDKNIIIKSNPGSLSQIITNLVINTITHAFNAKQEGLIKLSCEISKNDIVLKYSDNGKGMSKEVKDQIFNPFFTTNRANGGSGLGMNIIHNIVTRNLKGTIKIQSELNNGTLLTINVPNVYNID